MFIIESPHITGVQSLLHATLSHPSSHVSPAVVFVIESPHTAIVQSLLHVALSHPSSHISDPVISPSPHTSVALILTVNEVINTPSAFVLSLYCKVQSPKGFSPTNVHNVPVGLNVPSAGNHVTFPLAVPSSKRTVASAKTAPLSV